MALNKDVLAILSTNKPVSNAELQVRLKKSREQVSNAILTLRAFGHEIYAHGRREELTYIILKDEWK